MSLLIWILAVTLGISFLCSVLEAVFLSVTHSYVALLKESGTRTGRWLHAARRDVDEPIAAILTLNTLAHTMGATLAGAEAARVFGDPWVGVFSALLTLAVLVFTEIVPKTLGATYWKRLARPAAAVLCILVVVMKPFVVPLGWLTRLLTRGAKQPIVSRAELEKLAEIGRVEGEIREDEWRAVKGVIRLNEVSVAEVMTPRTDIVGASREASVSEVKRLVLETGHSRIPVFDGEIDKVVGFVVARDVWQAAEDGARTLAEVVRPGYFAPGSKPVVDLIAEMRSGGIGMTIVVDEFGGTDGLVTLEDLIEEIVGEIRDEHQTDEPMDFVELPSGQIRIRGGASLRTVAEKLAFTPGESEEEAYDTVGGFVFGRLDRIPKVGDSVAVESGTLQVTLMEGRRIAYIAFTARDGESGTS